MLISYGLLLPIIQPKMIIKRADIFYRYITRIPSSYERAYAKVRKIIPSSLLTEHCNNCIINVVLVVQNLSFKRTNIELYRKKSHYTITCP